MSYYGPIERAELLDEKSQLYRIYFYYAIGDRTTYANISIVETRTGYWNIAWSAIGIPASDWTAYKRWLIEKECMLSNFAW